MFWVAISMTVVANVAYQLCSKTASAVHPMIGLTATYAVALAVCLLSCPFLIGTQSFLSQVREISASNLLLGLSIVLLESGFILAFRAGWNVGYAALVSNVMATLVLVPISVLLFHQTMTLKNTTGIAAVLVGLWFILS